MTDHDVKKDFEESYTESTSTMSPYYQEADIDFQMFLGRQWTDSEVKDLAEQNRDAFVYNYTQRNINLMGGYQRKNRLGYGVFGIENQDDETATQLDRAIKFAAQYSNTYNKLSDGFEDASICGLSFMSLWLDYSNDMESPDVMTGVESFNSVFLDPNFTDQTLFDCRYMGRRRYVTKEEASSLLPKAKKDINALSGGVFDSKFPYLVMNKGSLQYYTDILSYDEFWQRKMRKVKLVVNRLNGQKFIWRDNFTELNSLLKAFPFLETRDKLEPTLNYSVFVQNELMYDGEDPLELDDYPLTPVIGTFKPSHWDWQYKLQGYVRPARDAQIEYNRKRSKMAAMLDQAALSTWLITDGSVKNDSDLYDPQAVKVIVRKKGSTPDDVIKLPNASIEPSLIQLSEILNRDILQIPGLNEEALGVAEGGNTQVSGVLAKMRAYNSVTILQKVFDNFNLSQKIHGKKLLTLVQKHWSDEKVERITSMPATAQFRDINFSKYDIVVANTLLTDTQKSAAFVEAVQAQAAGIPIPPSYTISKMVVSDPMELKRAYESQAKNEEASQQAMQRQQEITQNLAQAEIAFKMSLAEQQREKAVTEQADALYKLSSADANRAKAMLDNIKASKEIQSSDNDNLMKALMFLLKYENTAQQKDSIQVAQQSNKSEYDTMAQQTLNEKVAI